MPLSPKQIYHQEFQSKSIVMGIGYCALSAVLLVFLATMAQLLLHIRMNIGGLIGGIMVAATCFANVRARQAAQKKCEGLGVWDQLHSKRVIERAGHNIQPEAYELWLGGYYAVWGWCLRWMLIVLVSLCCVGLFPAFFQDQVWLWCALLLGMAIVMVVDFRTARFPLVGVDSVGVRFQNRLFTWDKIAAVELLRDFGPDNASEEKPYLTIRLLNEERNVLAKKIVPPSNKLSPEDYKSLERSLILHLYGEIKCQG